MTPRRITVAHLINGLGMGGAESMLLKLVSGMDRERFSNVVITLTDGGGLRPRLEEMGIRVFSLGMRRARPSISGFFRLLRILRDVEPDVIQTWLYHADLLGLIAARLARVPHCVWNIRVSNLDMKQYPRVSRWVLRVVARLSSLPDLVLVNSQTGRKSHEELHYRPKQWRVVPNGFDTERFRPDAVARRRFRDALGVSDATCLIGLIARCDPMKDHTTFFRAAQQLLRSEPEVRFLLAGSGVDERNESLTRMAGAFDLQGSLIWLGERHDMPDVMASLDVLALSSAFGEGFSNAIGEGMACGVPCVVTDVGDMAGIVGATGRVVATGDWEGMAGAWQELHDMGSEGRRLLGRAARERIVSDFSLSGIIREYEDVYEGVVGGKSG